MYRITSVDVMGNELQFAQSRQGPPCPVIAMIRKIVLALLCAVCALWGIVGAAIELWFYYRLPKALDNSTGCVYRLIVSHASVRFATEGDVRLFSLIHRGLPIACLLFASALLLGLCLGVFYIKGGVQHCSSVSES